MKPFLAIAALALFAIPAHADDTTVYTYTGNDLNQPGNLVNPPQCACNITGQMTFAQPLDLPTDIETVTGTPTSYWFSVDGYTLDQTNSVIEGFGIGDLNWALYLLGQNGLYINIQCVDGCGDGGGATDFAGFGGTDSIGVTVGHPGVWSVPEPSTHILLLCSIVGLIFLRRYRNSKVSA
jgi:hypothetical protein